MKITISISRTTRLRQSSFPCPPTVGTTRISRAFCRQPLRQSICCRGISTLLKLTTYGCFRSNLSLFLLADLIGMDPSCQIQWSDQAHVILQIAVIGLDSMRPLVCRHSRSAILNLCLLYASGCKNLSNVAAAILHNQVRSLFLCTLNKASLDSGSSKRGARKALLALWVRIRAPQSRRWCGLGRAQQ